MYHSTTNISSIKKLTLHKLACLVSCCCAFQCHPEEVITLVDKMSSTLSSPNKYIADKPKRISRLGISSLASSAHRKGSSASSSKASHNNPLKNDTAISNDRAKSRDVLLSDAVKNDFKEFCLCKIRLGGGNSAIGYA